MAITRINPDYSNRLSALEAFASSITLNGPTNMKISVAPNWAAFIFRYPSDSEYPYRTLIFNTSGKITYGKRKTENGAETNIFINEA